MNSRSRQSSDEHNRGRIEPGHHTQRPVLEPIPQNESTAMTSATKNSEEAPRRNHVADGARFSHGAEA